MKKQKRIHFRTRLGVLAATAGSAVGLGNIWKFPYQMGNSGGALFIIYYLLFIFLICLPLILGELLIGRHAQKDTVGAYASMASKKWKYLGFFNILTVFIVLSFYSVISAWTVHYFGWALSNGFSEKTPELLSQTFSELQQSPQMPFFWGLSFILLSGGILLFGVRNGIEKSNKILMPVLLLILIILFIKGLTLPNAGEGYRFIFSPDFSKLTPEILLKALGHAFFSLSLGMGVMVTYGSYIKKKENLSRTGLQICLLDTGIALLSGMVIMPIVFSFGVSPDAGPKLVFVTLPNLFAQMTGGYIFGVLFFVLLLIAALTSFISMLEMMVAALSEEWNLTRRQAVFWVVTAISITFTLCLLSIVEKSIISRVTILGKNIFHFLIEISEIMLTVGGIFISLLLGWFVSRKVLVKELTSHGKSAFILFGNSRFLFRWIIPLAISLTLVSSLIGIFYK